MTVPGPMFGNPVGPWRRLFAWWPVRLFDGTWVWLRFVSRRRIQLHQYLSGGSDHWWQYALPEDVG